MSDRFESKSACAQRQDAGEHKPSFGCKALAGRALAKPIAPGVECLFAFHDSGNSHNSTDPPWMTTGCFSSKDSSCCLSSESNRIKPTIWSVGCAEDASPR